MGLEFWRVGGLRPWTIAADAEQYERQGWDGILMGDNQSLAGDCYVGLAVAATSTSNLGLGVGVSNPVTRHPAVTASAAASLQALSGGRFVLGLGRGDSSLAHIGLAPAAPAVFDKYVSAVQTYLRGDGVALDQLERGEHRSSADLGAAGVPEDSRLHWLDPAWPKVPVDVAASGPAVIAIAARHAERVTFNVGADHERLAWAIGTAREARAAAGLDPATLELGAYVNVVAHPDVSVAIELARAGVTMFSRFSIMHGKTSGPLSEIARSGLERVSQTYDLRRHATADSAHAGAVDSEHVSTFGVVGTPAQCVDRLVALAELGLDRVVIVPVYADGSAAVERALADSTEALTAEVFPDVREKLT
jgi:5,10-methylenetetrahydromethanopterin reductase